MKFEYKTSGTCSSKILFDIDDGIVHDLEYIGGCNGKTFACNTAKNRL